MGTISPTGIAYYIPNYASTLSMKPTSKTASPFIIMSGHPRFGAREGQTVGAIQDEMCRRS